MTARRTRQYPIDYGLGSSFVEALEVPALFHPAAQLLQQMSLSGMVEVEFKYDARDNRYKLLDVNARPWGWHTLAMACGLNFPLMQYCALSDLPLPLAAPRYGSRWIRLLTDIPAGLQEIQAGITTPGAYLRSLPGKTVFSVLDWRDPLPIFGDFASAVIRRIAHLSTRRKRSQQRSIEEDRSRDEPATEPGVDTEKTISAPLAPSIAANEQKTQAQSNGTGRQKSFVISPAKARTHAPAPETVGAVVIGGDYQGLGIVRSLGRRGVPICIIDDERSISRFSRYATHAVHVKDLRNEQRTLETVLEVGQRLHLKNWVLFPTRDETVATFARYRAELAEEFRVPTPELRIIEWAWDKRKTYRLAQELNIPLPHTWYPADLQALEVITGEPPFVIKPAIKEHFIYATKAKAWKANNQAELAARFQQASEIMPSDEIMVQELIPGAGQQQFSYCAFFKNGHAVGSMVTRRRRQHPPEFGRASTFVETIDLPLLETLSTRFLQAMDYYGLVEVEYKLDPRDGQYKLLDVNARTWGYHSLGQSAGVDFPALLFADQLGEAVESCRAKDGVKWIRLATDLSTGMVEIFQKRLAWQAYIHTLKDVQAEAVFSLKDPLPGLVEVALLPYLFVKRGF